MTPPARPWSRPPSAAPGLSAIPALGIFAAVLAATGTAIIESHRPNAIGTTWLRAQTLAEPARGESLRLLIACTESAVRISESQPGSAVRSGGTSRGTKLSETQLIAEHLRPLDRAEHHPAEPPQPIS